MIFYGVGVSDGIAIGKAFSYQKKSVTINDLPSADVSADLEAYNAARDKAQAELEKLVRRFEDSGDKDKAGIFSAHIELLTDVEIDEEIQSCISDDEYNPLNAVSTVYDNYISVFEKIEDPIIRERAADLEDLKRRLLNILSGAENTDLSHLSEPVVVVAHDLVPSDTATMDRTNVLGIVTEIGGNTSHSAIIARNYGIPAVLGAEDICAKIAAGQDIIVDGREGLVIIDAEDPTVKAYQEKQERIDREKELTRRYLRETAVTTDGEKIEIELNLASVTPENLEPAQYTDGVGLFRSEFLYMGHESLPTEEEQFEVYRKVLMAFGNKPVALRTLDIGGDKKLDCLDLPVEENPFLGKRAIRLCFDNPEVFKTQLRAAFRASVYGKLWIMFPMVESMNDIYRAKEYVEKTRKELRAEGIPFDEDVKIGIMIEIPSIALIADKVAAEVDFASIGTNDLTQYCEAVDRGNPSIASYYSEYHPALFRLMGYAIREFNKRSKPICVCGEMGGNPLTALVLMGLGMRRLSMGASAIARIKQLICSISIAEAEEIANVVCDMSTDEEIKEYLSSKIHSKENSNVQ